MKTAVRNLLLIGATSTVPVIAVAQSMVTLYGRIDTGITYVSNVAGNHLYKEDDGVLYGNRWGFLGLEDLGGGNSAIFQLENGFTLGTGNANQGGAEFGRQAYVGLKNDRYGAITVGNQYDAMWDYIEASGFVLPAYGTGYVTHQGDFDGYSGLDRLPNSVKYTSPLLYGAKFGGMYSFGNIAGNFHQSSAWSLGARYAGGPFKTAIAYTRINNPSGRQGFDPYAQLGTTTFLGQTVARINPTTGVATDLYPNGIKVDSKGVFGVGASYAFKSIEFDTLYNNIVVKGFGTSSTMQVYEGGVRYTLTPAVFAIADYQRTRFEASRWSRYSTGIQYQLSKRTSIYTGVDYLLANANTRAALGWVFAPSTTNKQLDARIGLSTAF